jgi:DNA processing protein
MCVPGPVTSYTSQGVNNWVRQGRGTVVTHGSEVLELIGQAGEHLVEEPRGEERPRDALSRIEQQVLEWVPVSTPAEVDSIAHLSSLHVRDTVGALERLQAKRFVRLEEGGWRLVPDA